MVSMGAVTDSAHEVDDPRLLEDGGECNGTPESDVVELETESEGHTKSERVYQWALTERRTLGGSRRT